MQRFSGPDWTQSGPNILSDRNLRKVELALAEGWVCGLHYHHGGGGGNEKVGVAAYPEYLAYVLAAPPGDLFVLWSVANLRSQGLLLAEARLDCGVLEPRSLLSQDDLDRIHQYLAGRNHEVIAVALASGSTALTVLTADEDFFQDVVELAGSTSNTGGSMFVFPLTRDSCLIEAKRPNERGEVPRLGSY
jgi:hypothetical protein